MRGSRHLPCIRHEIPKCRLDATPSLRTQSGKLAFAQTNKQGMPTFVGIPYSNRMVAPRLMEAGKCRP